ncbi:MAG: sulfotransferase domain-containing protein [Mariniblastus sp.]|nr:sulfotransferase domain-containing protein [Mariniblastus sp.]
MVLRRGIQKLKNLAGKIDRRSYTCGLRSIEALSLPDFLGIGAQKAGTSWLAKNLRCHPELFVSEEKELHYFDRDFHRPLRHYASHFAQAGDRVKGEITPAYAILDRPTIRFIHKVMPELRLVYLLRNPVERAWSQAYMNLVSIPGRPYEEVDQAEFIRHFRSPRSVSRGAYLACIDRWLESFAEDQLLIEFFEDIAEQPQALLERVFEHLGVSQQVDWNRFPIGERVFSGGGVPIPDEIRLVLDEMYAADIEAIHQRFGDKTEPWRIQSQAEGTGT